MIKQLLNHAGAMAVAISAIIGGGIPAYGADGVEFTYGGISYRVLSESDKTATVAENTDITISALTIPSTVKSTDGTQYTVTEISEKAFSACATLKNLIIPESVTKIGAYAFNECALIDVVLPTGLTEIADHTFYKCNLKFVTIPSNVTTIGVSAFADNRLEAITMPQSVTTIETSAFANNSSLKSITSLNPTPPTLKATRGASSPFANCAEDVVVYVPKESLADYRKAAVWKLLPTFEGMGKFEVTVTPSELTLKVGETATLTAEVVKEDEVGITRYGWYQTNIYVASVAADTNETLWRKGIITALKAGTVRINYYIYDAAGRSATVVCEVTVYDPAGIDNVAGENGDAPAEYYNLQGVRVENPSAGIYIRRQGSTATKVVIR